MRFRLVWYITLADNRYESTERFEYLGDRHEIWRLWYQLKRICGYPHVDVYNLSGMLLKPEEGIQAMIDTVP